MILQVEKYIYIINMYWILILYDLQIWLFLNVHNFIFLFLLFTNKTYLLIKF